MNYYYLNPKFLLSNPDIYHEALKFAKEDIENDYSRILNDTTLHYGWYSPHVMLLAYLVGDLKDDIYEKNKDQSINLNEGEECYWGALVQKGIPEEQAIEMLKIMIELGADLKIKDFYEKDIFDWSKGGVNLSSNRINNEKFKEAVQILYQE